MFPNTNVKNVPDREENKLRSFDKAEHKTTLIQKIERAGKLDGERTDWKTKEEDR